MLTTTRSGGARNKERPGKASANATMDATSQAALSSPSNSHTRIHKDRTVTPGSRKTSSASNKRLWASAVLAAAEGGEGGDGTVPSTGLASGMGAHPLHP